ncbi:MAG: hypothetical protein QM731_24990 [Chitinophagaceae bacterium]
MARVKNNIIMRGVSGKVGDQLVFNQRNGQTVVSKVPRVSKKVPKGRKEANDRFKQASKYAKQASFDPVLKAAYSKYISPGRSVYAIALGDFLDTPEIQQLITRKYTGDAGSSITIFTRPKGIIDHIHIIITNSSGEIVESGYAVQVDDGSMWNYTAMVDNPSLEGTIVTVEATDFAKNVGLMNGVV